MTSTLGKHEFSVLDSEQLLDSPILSLRRDRLVMPGGGQGAREVVEHFGAVAVVAVDEQGRIPLVYQYRHAVGQRLWELPAGLLDIAGEDELTCAGRELEEEAGLAARDWGVLVDLVTSPGFCDEAVRVFLARGLFEVARPVAEDEEADLILDWVDLDQAREMVLSGQIVNSIAIAGILTATEVMAGRAQPREVAEPFAFRPDSLASRRQSAGVSPDMKKINR
ncbi:NUDIX domain-containing protein [Corynebacterium alimapuense]|uniref:ADP-ribose pyrophosphatase n=1 Tax=Corynebacterium alimapuense TaxID=1576874 RepID=A0A3M8K7H1_9CORY|nr:NUDIX hydrolase [Corynebacterium alimapuense]RNE49090.1 ADP-ribose pyrophosphatase [Corynebacterium alimapuense]